MKIGTMYFRDSYGWPVELFTGRPVTNFIRILIHTDIGKTWTLRKREKATPWDTASGAYGPRTEDSQWVQTSRETHEPEFGTARPADDYVYHRVPNPEIREAADRVVSLSQITQHQVIDYSAWQAMSQAERARLDIALLKALRKLSQEEAEITKAAIIRHNGRTE